MTLELGDVIAQIGGDGGGGGPVPHRYVYDFGHAPIPVDGAIMHEVPDVPEGATLVVTLDWSGPEATEIGGPAVTMWHAFDDVGALGVPVDPFGSGFLPITVVSTASGEERGSFAVAALTEGYTATTLTAIVIPAIK